MQKIGRVAALVLLGLAVGLCGCSKPQPRTTAHRSGISLGADRVPLGRLPRVAVPLRYRIALRIDPRQERFSGHTEIDVRFALPARALFLHGLDLNVSGVSVRLKSGQIFAAHYDQVDPSGVARLIFVDRVPAGEATLIFDYDAPFDRSLEGLYKVVDRGDAYAFTQFESTDARRAFPSFDEPGFKTPFDVTVIAPKGMRVIGNTPIVAAAPAAHGMVDTVLQATRPLPTYLIALAVGPLDVVDGGWVPANRTRAKPLHIRGIVARGNGPRIAYALSLTPKIVTALENYFGIGYPFQKLDILAVPDFAAGAMENAGAVTFRERYLLLDADATLEQKRGSLAVQAHELAHQWFGDLVTMQWWDDLWLNEGFATWMEDKATDHFHPEWNLWLVALTQADAAMRVDSRGGTHPVIQPIRDVLLADQYFDTITYSKGMAVIRMLEHYVGEQAFRKGVHSYLKSHAYGNAVTDDLWAALDKASARPVSKIAREFTLQAGVPLINVARGPQGVVLTQDRFYSDASERSATAWDVPVVERPLAGGPVWRGVVGHETAQNISLAAGAIPIVNDGRTGYFRTLYSQDLFAGLSSRFGKVTTADQLGLFQDTTALALAGYEPLPDVLMLAGQIKPSMDPVVARAVVAELHDLDGFYRDLPGRPAYTEYARGLLRPLLAKLGWSESTQEGAGSRQLRGRLLQTLGQIDDPDVIAKARSLFGEYLKNPRSLTGEPRLAVLDIVARHADATAWEQLRQLALHATVPTEAQRYFRLLGIARDRALAQRALDLTLTNEASVTFRPDIIDAVAAYYPDMAFEFAAAHLQEVYAGVEPDNRVPYMAELLAHANSATSADTLRAFAKAHIPPSNQHAVQVTLAGIAYNAKVRKEDIPQLDRWLQSAH